MLPPAIAFRSMHTNPEKRSLGEADCDEFLGEREAHIRTCSLYHSIIGLARTLFIFLGVLKVFAEGPWIALIGLFLDNAHMISLDP
jgi:hypothetical protein